LFANFKSEYILLPISLAVDFIYYILFLGIYTSKDLTTYPVYAFYNLSNIIL